MTLFVDTNIFLRFLTHDHEEQYKRCTSLLEKAKRGKVHLQTSALTMFEIIWTLESYYEEPKQSIIEKMTGLLSFPNITVEHRDVFLEAFVLWDGASVSFNDAFNAIWMQREEISSLYSYDRGFDRLGVQRLEP
ncbi:MAG: PIN domain-containing protein [bacterium]|nr:PIN domain-containing protein [bacterium]